MAMMSRSVLSSTSALPYSILLENSPQPDVPTPLIISVLNDVFVGRVSKYPTIYSLLSLLPGTHVQVALFSNTFLTASGANFSTSSCSFTSTLTVALP